MIKARKLPSNTSLNSMIDEIVKGAFYKYVRTDLGVVLECEYDMKRKKAGHMDVLIFHMKILKGGDFADYIYEDQFDNPVNLQVSFHTFKNFISLVADFNDLGFYHRDLKPGNVFYVADETSPDKIKLVLIDFAFTSDVKFDKKYKGTRKYMAEEMMEEDKLKKWYNETIDSFSAGSSAVEFFMERFYQFEDIDLGLLYIIDAMLKPNHCEPEDHNGIHCHN